MVILDELCSGTNPSEGEEIFELVVRMLTQARAAGVHHDALPRVRGDGSSESERSRSCASSRSSSVPSSEPTYQFVPGVAQTSLAGHAAARLGVTRDQLLALIDRNIAHASRTA